jgi:hypothetical protein
LSAENSKGVKYVKWTDKRAVHMLTTRRNHSCSLVEGVNGQIKPDCVFDYNKAKKGVDISDQIGAYYSVLRKTIKWYRKVILELICSTFVVNSWYIHKKWGISNFNVLKFRELIIDGLLQDQPCEKIETKSNKSTQHFLEKFSKSPGTCRKRCHECYKRLSKRKGRDYATLKSKRVTTFCRYCENEPPMCLKCFKKVHKNN